MWSEWLVERLSRTDILRNVRLASSVGWPDDEADWRVVYDAGVVLGVRRGDELVGQGALGVFGSAGTIAKMVVAPHARRQGIASAILDALLAEAHRSRLHVLGLVATPLGQPLYATRGFEAVGEVVISSGVPTLGAPSEVEVRQANEAQILALESRFMAVSRREVLRGRMREASASVVAPGGFALATAAGTGFRLGPILAEDEALARALTVSLARALPGPLRLDVPGDQRGFRGFLKEIGLIEKGVHVEMARGGKLPWAVPQRFGLATQAWG